MKPVRIGLLGSGFVADFYMQGLANVKDHEVVFNYSRSLERARLFAQRWSIPEYTNFREVVFRDDIDLFIIALPNEEHLPVSLALSAGKRNQVCTKPLGRNAMEARQMMEAARASGAIHGYAETEVFAPAVVRAKESVENGGIGRILWVRSRESHSGPHSPHFWDVDNTGGGALNDLGCHCIEAARYLSGKKDKLTEVMRGARIWSSKTKRRARIIRSSAHCGKTKSLRAAQSSHPATPPEADLLQLSLTLYRGVFRCPCLQM